MLSRSTVIFTATCLLLLGSWTHAKPIPYSSSRTLSTTGRKGTSSPIPIPTLIPGHLRPEPTWLQWPPVDALAVTPRFKPIYVTDEVVDFIVDVPKDSLETSVTLHFDGAGSTAFEAPVRPGTNIVSVPRANIAATTTDVTVTVGSDKAKATFAIHHQPAPGTSHTIRVDYLHGSLVPQQQPGSVPSPSKPALFPFGMYAGFSSFGAKDPVGAMRELKEMGINHVNFVPPYEDGVQIKALLAAAHDVGVSIQYDMRHTYINTANVTSEVNSVKAYDSLATWYTADEPDGQGFAPEPQSSINAYRTINSIDPHRPVMLVLNLAHTSAAQFAPAVDIMMTDVYPIGLDPLQCNPGPNGGCCGCNGCVGDMATDIRRRMQSYRSQLAKIGKPRMPIWMVLQAFSDPKSCWARAPTPAEYNLMAYVSLIYGAKGLMGWIYPGGLTPELKQLVPTLSRELVPLASRFILGGDQIVEYTVSKQQISAGAWRTTVDGARLYIVANTGNNAVTLSDADVAAIFGQDTVLVEGRRTLEPLAVLTLTTN
ncbi:hypothetical protein BGZ95_011726 [Linnemannia exigua]|uniref:Uncharacterized protein n=1 Tax=Linnemannia exigua TaxID=604196 RepID=A0AAD4H527_9FUNG|nr:hypothetical protein BGZ95_011726 [Linnemannia exigua]